MHGHKEVRSGEKSRAAKKGVVFDGKAVAWSFYRGEDLWWCLRNSHKCWWRFVSLYTLWFWDLYFINFGNPKKKHGWKYMFHAIHVHPVISGGGVQLKKRCKMNHLALATSNLVKSFWTSHKMQQHQRLPSENYQLVHLKIRPLEKEKHRPWTTNFWGSKCMFFGGLGPKMALETTTSAHFRPWARLGAGPCSGCGRRRGGFGHSCAIGQRRDEGATGTGNRNMLVQLCPDILPCGSDGSLMIFGGLDHFPQLQVISHQLRKKLFISLFLGFLEIPGGVNPRWVGFFPLHKPYHPYSLYDCEDSSILGTWNVWRSNLEDHPT